MIKKYLYFLFILSFVYASDLIKNIQISGNTKTKDKIILKAIQHPLGISFNSTIAKKDQEDIYNLNIFNFVQIGYIDSTYHIIVEEKSNFSISPLIIKNNSLDKGFGPKILFHNIKGNNNQIELGGAFGKIKHIYIQYQNSLINRKNQSYSITSFYEKNKNIIDSYVQISSTTKLSYDFKKNQKKISIFLNNEKKQVTYEENNIQNFHFINTGIDYELNKKTIYKTIKFNLCFSKFLSLNDIANYAKLSVQHHHVKKLSNEKSSPYLSINSQAQFISKEFSPIYETIYLGGDELVRSYETDPKLNNTEVQNKLKFNNLIFNSIQFEIPIFFTNTIQNNIFFFIDQAIGGNQSIHFERFNAIKGYGVGYSISTKKKIKFDLSIGINDYGQRLFHFNVMSTS